MDSSKKPPAAAIAAAEAQRRRRTAVPLGESGGQLSRAKVWSGGAEKRGGRERNRGAWGGEKREKEGGGGEGVEEMMKSKGVRVVAADMGEEQVHAVVCARKSYDSLPKLAAKSLAFALKKEFDGEYGPAWHCVVGKSFGSFVTHSVGGFVYMCIDHKLYVLLFKTAVLRATSS